MDKSFIVNVLIVLAILCILMSLGASLYFLVKDQGQTKRTVRALSWRITLSLLLFFMLFLAFAMGWITPHSLFSR